MAVGHADARRRRSGEFEPTRRRADSRRPPRWTARSAERRGEVRHRHRAPRPRRQGPRRPGPRADRAAGRDPADRLHHRHRRAVGRRGARQAGGALPGAQDQGRRPAATSRRSRRSAGCSTARSASTPTPAGPPTTPLDLLPAPRATSASSSSSSRSRARRLDQWRWLQERSSLPIVADESCVMPEDLDGLVGVVDGVNVKLAKCGGIAAGQGDAVARPRTRVPDVPRLHGGDAGRDRRHRRPWRRWPTGSTSTAACCWPTIRSRGWTSTADHRWILPAGAGSRADAHGSLTPPPRSLGTGVRRTSVRVDNLVDELVDKPPSRLARRGLRCPVPAAETRGGGRPGHRDHPRPAGGSITPIPSDRASYCLRRVRPTAGRRLPEGGHAIDGIAHRRPRS